MLASSLISYSQLTTLHSPDECNLLTNTGANNVTYTEAVTNPDVSDTSNPNVSSLLASANNGSGFYSFGYSIPTTETSLDWSFRYYTANSGANNSGSGRYIVRLFNDAVGTGTYKQLTLGNKTGGSWQTATGTVDLSSTTKGDITAVNVNGGWDRLLILPSSNASSIETFYFDDFQFSDVPDLNLSSVASLDAGKAWLYSNNSGDFNAESINNIITGTVQENQATPTTTGNNSNTVLKFTRGDDTPSSGIRFRVPTPFNYTTASLKFRVFAACNLNAVANYRVQLRNDNLVA